MGFSWLPTVNGRPRMCSFFSCVPCANLLSSSSSPHTPDPQLFLPTCATPRRYSLGSYVTSLARSCTRFIRPDPRKPCPVCFVWSWTAWIENMNEQTVVFRNDESRDQKLPAWGARWSAMNRHCIDCNVTWSCRIYALFAAVSRPVLQFPSPEPGSWEWQAIRGRTN
jgi:hypothetical protein